MIGKFGQKVYIKGATYQYGILDGYIGLYVCDGGTARGEKVTYILQDENLLRYLEDKYLSFGITKTLMSNITSIIKNITRTEPEKTFVKVGFIDEQENITEKGKEALSYILWQQNKEKVKELADKINEQESK